MCFSAEASFTVGTVIGAIGALTLKKTGFGRYSLLAAIPLLFALQQYAEGFVWLHLNGTYTNAQALMLLSQFFLFFAWIMWPVYIPLAFTVSEPPGMRRGIMITALIVGLGVSLLDLASLLQHAVVPTILENSIDYGITSPEQNLVYAFATLTPFFVSSIPRMGFFGLALVISYIAAQIVWALAFTSVWCFFVAASSLVLYWVIPAKKSLDLYRN